MTPRTRDEARWDAERLIESLRSGVPLPHPAAELPIGRERLLRLVEERMNAFGPPQPLVLRANYGEGKTHFLHAAAAKALAAHWVVSMVPISREAPLDSLDKLYGRVAAEMRVPDSHRIGIQSILEKLHGVEGVHESLRAAGIPDRLVKSVAAYLQDDPTFRDELLGELSGRFLTVGRLKQILGQLFGDKPRLDPFSPTKDAIWCFRLLAHLTQLAGYQGWMLQLDEVELIGTTGTGQRARSYSNLAWLGEGLGPTPRTLVLSTLAANYYTDVMEPRHDETNAPAWLESRGRVEEAERARRGLELLRRAEPLPPLTRQEVDTLLLAIRDAHARAYDWQPPDADHFLQEIHRIVRGGGERLRSRIRASVQWLDLWMQYGRDPTITVWNPGEVVLAETAGELDSLEPEPDPSAAGVWRNRIFPL